MTEILAPATVTPFDTAGDRLETGQAITFDFNPETLTIESSAGAESDRGRRGRQQVQHVARTHASLSFEAVFDTTRPNPSRRPNGTAGTEEALDVRGKTATLGALLRDAPSRRNRAPRRVRFGWGSVVFDGVLTRFSETLDYFSPGGVPLRSKVSVTIVEQDFRYEVRPPAPAPERAGTLAEDAAALGRAADVDDLDALLDGTGFGLASGAEIIDAVAATASGIEAKADAALRRALGLGADFGRGLRAGTELGPAAALAVFGPASLGISDGLAGCIAGPRGDDGAPAMRTAAGAWAPEGPTPGTAATDIARAVVEARMAGRADAVGPAGFAAGTDATRPPAVPGRAAPPPLRGAPPTRVPAFGPGIPSLAAGQAGGPAARLAARRPAWETLGAIGAEMAPPHDCACGCKGDCAC